MSHRGKVFIDANILIYAAAYRKSDVLLWISQLSEAVYVHIEVLNELQTASVSNKVKEYLESGKWKLFNPLDEVSVSDEMYQLYDSYFKDIKEYFNVLNIKKEKNLRKVKNTNDLGEIHTLAAAILLNVNIICSTDYDVREIIQDNKIMISVNGETDELIRQDTLVDYCCFVIQTKIEKKSVVRQFLKVTDQSIISELDRCLSKSNI